MIVPPAFSSSRTVHRPPRRSCSPCASGRCAAPAHFVLLVPGGSSGVVAVDGPDDVEDPGTRMLLRMALPALRGAARGPIEILIGGHDPVAAVSDAINFHDIDEVIVSSPSTRRVSRLLRVDLARRLEHLGLPVTSVESTDVPAVPRS